MKHEKHEHGKMIDNRKVSDNHQEGIERVKQRKGDLKAGQQGKMGAPKERGHWERKGPKEVPKRA